MANEKRAVIACYNCRKRKVRCDRTIPNCSPCRNLQRSCNYPEGIKKPGPRLGSVHKKRQIREAAQHTKHVLVDAVSSLCEDNSHDRDDDDSVLSFAEAAYGPRRQQQNKDIQSISYIIHPSHEYCELPNSKSNNHSNPDVTNTNDRAVLSACRSLGLTRNSMQVMLDAFLKTYTAFHLFRESTASSKFLEIATDAQITALLAAIAIFTHRHVVSGSDPISHGRRHTSRYFSEMAEQYINQAIAQCGDDPPPLCVLQALILSTHWQLVQGVRGRAWRSLGLCIRIAYELGLHAIDENPNWHLRQQDPEQWCQDEERRRAWWAVWEMDVFASTLYRVPSTIKWGDARVWLPAEDKRWFLGNPQKSCCLQTGLLDRCKYLQKSGNESPKAWFIILNSLMAEAYESSFRRKNVGKKEYNNDRSTDTETPNHDTVFTETLLNAIQACALSVPAQWRYRSQFLSFDGLANERETTGSTIQTDSSIYDIALMQEVAKLMTLKNYVFEGGAKQLLQTVENLSQDSGISTHRPATYQKNQMIQTYFHASDAIMGILANCSDCHIRYTNPFIAHAAWMAAAVQLLRLELVKSGPQQDLIRSRFEVLQATHRQFVEYWSMSSVPQQNLKTLAVQLKHWMHFSRPHGIRRSQLGSAATDTMSRRNLSDTTGGNLLNGNNSTSNEKESESEAQGMTTSRDVPDRINARSSPSLPKERIDLVPSSNPVWPSPGRRSGSPSSQLQGVTYNDLAPEANYVDLGLTNSVDPTTSLSLHPIFMGDTLSTFVGADMSMLPKFNPDPLDWFGVPTDQVIMTPDISNYLDVSFSGVRRE